MRLDFAFCRLNAFFGFIKLFFGDGKLNFKRGDFRLGVFYRLFGKDFFAFRLVAHLNDIVKIAARFVQIRLNFGDFAVFCQNICNIGFPAAARDRTVRGDKVAVKRHYLECIAIHLGNSDCGVKVVHDKRVSEHAADNSFEPAFVFDKVSGKAYDTVFFQHAHLVGVGFSAPDDVDGLESNLSVTLAF